MDEAAALLITGTVGAGKTSVAEAAGELLAERRTPHAVIDLDGLRRFWPAPEDDPFSLGLTLRNLRDVARNFLNAGARRLVLAGVVEQLRGGLVDGGGGVRVLVRVHADDDHPGSSLLRVGQDAIAGRRSLGAASWLNTCLSPQREG